MHTLEQLRSGALAGTRRLDLSCDLEHLPPEVMDLADTLEVLNLSGNRLSDLPSGLSRLRKLRIVFCSDNDFTKLPEVLGECPELEMVGFKANRIDAVPAAALPERLRWLILTDNAIDRLPDGLGQRPALQKLMLAGNRLSALPEGLAHAERLELLRISANRFTALPTWLTRLPRLAWLALAGNPLGWTRASDSSLPRVSWQQLRMGERLGEGASGHIHRVWRHDAPGPSLALKLFKGAVTSDGLPEHELAACRAVGAHPSLCTPVAELEGHPQGIPGLLMPEIPAGMRILADPPSLVSCTRDVYPSGFTMSAAGAFRVAGRMAHALAHLHGRGVMHGDFYAHNMHWDPLSAEALLGDFGGATVLPDNDLALRQALLALDVRAFGCLLEELLAHSPPGEHASWLASVASACLLPEPERRPSMADVCADWPDAAFARPC